LLHGHCQQKALLGTGCTQRGLQQIPGLNVQIVDSGCCGMAGSFGYEHYDVSMQIGERVLFPAIKRHTTGPVVAPGFSCRHQISEGTAQTAMHPVELLARQARRTQG
jgi:Fe-S oxidoreductase